MFEKCKVKNKCFHSFSRSEKWNQNAARPRSRSENSREFLTILEKRDFTTELFDKEEEVVDFQDDFTHLALASTTRGGLTTWRRTSTRLSTRTLMTWRANLRSSRSSFLFDIPDNKHNMFNIKICVKKFRLHQLYVSLLQLAKVVCDFYL